MEQENQTVNESDIEINLGDLFRALWSKAWLLLLCLVVGAAVGFGYTRLTYTYVPMYSSTLSIYLYTITADTDTNTEEDDTTISSSTVSSNLLRQSMINLDCDDFRDTLKEQLGDSCTSELISGGSVDTIANKTYIEAGSASEGFITIAYSCNTNVSTLSPVVTGTDKDEVQAVAEQLVESIPEYLTPYLGVSTGFRSLNHVSVSLTNSSEELSTTIKFVALFGLGLFAVAAVIIVIVHLVDNRVKKSEEITRQVGLPVLGVIPNLPNPNEADAKKGKK